MSVVIVQRFAPRKHMLHVEVEHHGHWSATIVGGPGQGPANQMDAEARAAKMLSRLVGTCRTIGPVDCGQVDIFDERSMCPDDAMDKVPS